MNKSHRKKKSKSSDHHHHHQKEIFSDASEENVNTLNKNDKRNAVYEVKKSEEMGRYIVAARDLDPGNIVISELPIVIGPCGGCNVLCLGCYKRFDENNLLNVYRCKNCKWPLCGPLCEGIGAPFGHSNAECSALRAANVSKLMDFTKVERLMGEFNAITPLRCLLLKKTDPAKWDILMTMEPHNVIRKAVPELWGNNQLQVVDRIRQHWGMQQYTEEEIHTICGILEVNAFEIGPHDRAVRGIYPTAFLLSHDCVPNTTHADDGHTYQLTIRVTTKVKRGTPITLSYAYTLQNTLKRREQLLESKFFWCKCNRCSDPTELSTHVSSLRCPKCNSGYVISSDPLDQEASWKCSSPVCGGYTITAAQVNALNNKIADEIDSIDINDIKRYEMFLERYRNVLHPNHYHNLGVKHMLSQLYGKITGYMIDELSRDMLIRKQNICKEILSVFDVLEPGYSRIRGITLYELHAPIMILVTRNFENRSITKSELRNRLKEVTMYLEEATSILGFESQHYSEGMMALAAKDALVRIQEWQKIITKM